MNEYKIFMNWLFDGNVNSPIPAPDPEYGIPDILKYNSYITHTYMISLFIKIGNLNHYLNEYMYNINLRYISKNDLMIYIKDCIIRNKIKKYQLHYFIYTRKHVIFNILQEKCPYLKKDDILMICKQIDNSKEKESIYQTLGIIKPEKQKVKKIRSEEKISLKKFINDNFSIIEM
jgi:hypothetical protein